uniref:Uncharacterized protein n=1 Tax=Pristionchus pacificus TaxID=54126 RepID=A0A2A6BHK4_PRIPA|eukprot:PDM65374.1 hypothetical protein PRIPAC_52316 [Pristionchus pacificus]
MVIEETLTLSLICASFFFFSFAMSMSCTQFSRKHVENYRCPVAIFDAEIVFTTCNRIDEH